MNPISLLFFVFLAVPVLEIYLLIKIGSFFGALTTVFLVVATAVAGAWLLRFQGLSTWNRVQESLNRGDVPAIEMVEGLILLVSGALLLTPGFFTDTVGFVCLVPAFRKSIALYLLKNKFSVGPGGPGSGSGRGDRGPSGPTTIDGEFRREDD